MKTYFRSCAEWPTGLIYGDNTTMDRHDTKDQAEAVCKMLERNGLGGERCHFPVRTWTEEVPDTSPTKET